MRVMVMTGPSTTHLMLMAPLAWALQAAGDQVLVVGQPDIVAAAHSAGLSVAMVGEEHREVDRWRRRKPSVGQGPPWESLRQEWRERAERVCPQALAVARTWRPDLVVAEPLEFCAQVVGGVLDVPVVRHRWGVDVVAADRARHMREALHTYCAGLGLDGLPEPALILDPCPPGVQSPDAAPSRPIRSVPSNGCGTLPDWALHRTAARRICVSLGTRTLRMDGLPMLRNAIEACGSLEDTETIVTADAAFREQIGPLPRSVRVVVPSPLDLFLRGCDAIVHHGGWGTALTTMAFGLPHVVLPRFPYLAEVADRIAHAGVGISVEPSGQGDTAVIRDAVRAVLTEPTYAEAARALERAMAQMPTPAQVVGTLHDLAESRTAA